MIKFIEDSSYFRIFILVISCIVFNSCSTKKSLYQDKQQYKSNKYIAEEVKQGDYKSFMLLGNSGTKESGLHKALEGHIIKKLETYTSDDYLILLGDNIKNNVVKKDAITDQMEGLTEILNKFNGNTLIIPGEREWKEKGTKGLADVEEFFEENLIDEEYFQPEKGCPIETINVNDDIELIIVDSQWYIQNWDKLPHINDKCEIKTRAQFIVELKDKIKKASHKTVLLAMHHPLYSNGLHGGYLPASLILNPTSENAFMPILGSIYSLLRAQGGISKQDRYNPMMNELMTEVEIALNQAPRAFLLSGHEQALQYIEQDHIRQIVSGTSSTSLGAALAKNGQFSSGSIGFSELRIYEDGTSQVHYYGLDEDKDLMRLYQKEAYPAKTHYNVAKLPKEFPATVVSSIHPQEDVKVDAKYEEKWGKHYRYVYGLKVEAPVALLDTLYGGLKVERAGGGNQTLSLRLEDANGKEYNMRALAKDPISFLQASGYNDLDADAYFSETLPAELIADFYTAAHPFGAFVIASLSHEINIKHTHPKLYYVPKQKTLGDFNDVHGDRLYMIEQKPDEDFNNSHMFGRSNEIINTVELLEELRDDDKNQVDEEEYIRARIFDMLLGDWDRHEGQWSWSKREEGDLNIYSPVPRDRDQVFANFDGKFLETLQKFIGRTRQFGKYGPDIAFVENFSESAINLDRAIIQRSDKQVWLDQIKIIQDRLDKEAVTKAFSQVPEEIKDEVWKNIQDDLLLRKNNLESIVNRYLDYFLRFQTLKGTDKDDIFIIERQQNGIIHIIAHRIKDGEKGKVLFDRTFNDNETKDLWVYGLDDKDVFEISGKKSSKINLVIIGGLDGDSYDVKNGKGILIYDQNDKDEKIIKRGGAKIRSSSNYSNRIYNPEIRPGKSKLVGLNFEYNPDEGFVPQLQVGSKKMGFERNPFTSKMVLNARYISLTQAFDIRPEVHIANIFARWNLKLEGRATSNNYTENFFGFGNNSPNVANNYDSNRILMQRFNAGVSIYRVGSYGSTFEFGAQYNHIATDESNFINIGNSSGSLSYVKAMGSFSYKSVDNDNFPTRGLNTEIHTTVSNNLEHLGMTWSLDPKFVMWNALDYQRKLVLKNAVKGQFRLGEDIPFYQSATLGGNSGLRSYRNNRFLGDVSLVTSADLWYEFKPLKTALFPLRVSSFIGYDIGRVWYDGDSLGNWHDSYGGGIKMEMAGMVNFEINYFSGREGGRLSFSFVLGL